LAGLRKRLLLDMFVVGDRLPEVNDPEHGLDQEDVAEIAIEGAREAFHRKLENFGPHGERVMSFIMLTTIDDKWKDHLYDLDHLKASIGFRGWGQKDPLVEYKKEAYEMFVDLMHDLRSTVSQNFFKAQIAIQQPRVQPRQRLTFIGPSETPETGVGGAPAQVARAAAPLEERAPAPAPGVDESGISRRAARVTPTASAGAGGVGALAGMGAPATDVSKLATNRGEERKHQPTTVADEPGRNDPCPCGSGKKYKKCHGRVG